MVLKQVSVVIPEALFIAIRNVRKTRFHYSQDIRDGHGNRIGSVRKIDNYGSDVWDSSGNRLGNTNQAGTFDASGNRVADRQVPGLLIQKPKKKS